MANQEYLDFLKEIISQFITILGYQDSYDVQITPSIDDKDGISVYRIDILGEELGSLIGYHGQALEAFSHLLKIAFFQKFKIEEAHLHVDINNYRQQREAYLISLAKKTSDKVRFLRTQIVLPPMSSVDRFVIHNFLSSDSSINTESIGEGSGRRIVIKPTSM